jgi:hypothetical protein
MTDECVAERKMDFRCLRDPSEFTDLLVVSDYESSNEMMARLLLSKHQRLDRETKAQDHCLCSVSIDPICRGVRRYQLNTKCACLSMPSGRHGRCPFKEGSS